MDLNVSAYVPLDRFNEINFVNFELIKLNLLLDDRVINQAGQPKDFLTKKANNHEKLLNGPKFTILKSNLEYGNKFYRFNEYELTQ